MEKVWFVMALVTNITKEVQIPNEDASATIRRLSYVQLEAAAKARQSKGVSFMREMGGELLKALRDADETKIKQLQEKQEADITNYDRGMLLRLGISSWTYEVAPIAAEVQVGVKPTDGIDQLDEPTARFLAQEIFDFSRPETPEMRKNV